MGAPAYALRVAAGAGGEGCETIAVFATATEAVDYYGTREDLHGYFWGIHPEVVAQDLELPRVFWPREKVAAAL